MSTTAAGNWRNRFLHMPVDVSTVLLLLIASQALNAASCNSMWFQLWFHAWIFYSSSMLWNMWLTLQMTSCPDLSWGKVPVLHTTTTVLPWHLVMWESLRLHNFQTCWVTVQFSLQTLLHFKSLFACCSCEEQFGDILNPKMTEREINNSVHRKPFWFLRLGLKRPVNCSCCAMIFLVIIPDLLSSAGDMSRLCRHSEGDEKPT